jgi:hypothetical protein
MIIIIIDFVFAYRRQQLAMEFEGSNSPGGGEEYPLGGGVHPMGGGGGLHGTRWAQTASQVRYSLIINKPSICSIGFNP